MFTSSLPRVHVVGANAHGYTSAILLLLQGYKVTMVANGFPGDADYTYNYPDNTTSQWQTDVSSSDENLQQYDVVSFKMFWNLAKRNASESGVMIGSSFKYYQDPTKDQSNPWWKNIVPGFETIQNQNLPNDVQLGHQYTTVLINSKRYLEWLQTQFLAMGGRQRKMSISKTLDMISDQNHASMIVNCSDDLPIGTTSLDSTQQNIHQQWIVYASHVRKAVQVKTKDGDMYVFPRMDGTVVVGSSSRHKQQDGNATQLLKKLAEYCPELTWGKGVDGLKIIDSEKLTKSIRQNGPRVENQYIVTPLGTRIAVTHNYGHNGYQSSWGSSKHAVRLVDQAFANLKKDSQSVSELLSHL